ncbi:hypothetical protein N1851_013856 [Merluccius polli]|uniref:Uncharacterized protein n=1 Tax=Merluccius polli TaxID=89951 RepID=A0AA47MVK2_MERPO|nr:hypothetical protein N1851_013856 [Merluccius polli]
MSSAKRLGELHALSVSRECLQWSPDGTGVHACPRYMQTRRFYPRPSLQRTLTSRSVWEPSSPQARERNWGRVIFVFAQSEY